MIQVDLPMAFAAGGMMAGAARRQLASGSEALARSVRHTATVYFLFFFGWIPILFAVTNFGWETSHLWWHAGSARAYPYFLPALWLTLAIALHGGLRFGQWLIRRGLTAVNRAIYSAVLIYSVGWVIAAGDRVQRLGTYAQFQAGHAPLWTADKAFLWRLIATMIIWPGALVAALVVLDRQGRRLVVEERV